jgi:hypothetical protein
MYPKQGQLKDADWDKSQCKEIEEQVEELDC